MRLTSARSDFGAIGLRRNQAGRRVVESLCFPVLFLLACASAPK